MDIAGRPIFLVVASLVGVIGGGATANAEAGSPAAGSSSPGQPPIVVEEIVVTAQKESQSLQRVAGAVSAISGRQLQNRAIQSFGDVARSVPGVDYTETNGASQISVRGVGLLVATGVAEPNVAVHVDGVFQPQATEIDVEPVDIDRVEILKGPQGTLYGRNATGGAVNFVTAKPTDDFRGAISVGTGSFAAARASGYASGPLIDNQLDGRLSAYYASDDGYYRNTYLNRNEAGFEKYGFRGALRERFAPNFTVDLTGYYQHMDMDGPIQTLLRGSNPFVDALIGAGVLQPSQIVTDTRPDHDAGETSPHTSAHTWGLTMDASWDISKAFAVRSVTGYINHQYGPSVFDADGTSLGIVNIGGGAPFGPRVQTSRSFSQEFNIHGRLLDDRLKYLGGLFYFQEDADATIPSVFLDPTIQAVLGQALAPLTQDPDTLFTGQQQSMSSRTRSYAVFGDATYSVAPTFRLNFGARESFDRKRFGQNISFGADLSGVPVTLPLCHGLETKLDYDRFDYKARAEWDAADHILAYGQYETGFKDGGVNISGCGDVFAPEKVKSWEGGVKSVLADGAVTLNLSGFHYSYDGLQVLAFRNTTDAFIDNIPESEVYGGEIEAVARVSRFIDVNAGLSLLHGRITKFTSFDTENPAAGLQNLDGRPLPNSPGATLTAGVSYVRPVGQGEMRLRAETFASSSKNFRVFGDKADEQGAYTVTNLIAAYSFHHNRYTVQAYVKNLEDTHYWQFELYAAQTGVAGQYARPREAGVDLSAKF